MSTFIKCRSILKDSDFFKHSEGFFSKITIKEKVLVWWELRQSKIAKHNCLHVS